MRDHEPICLFSVVIPAFNRAHELKGAIESVLTGSCSDFEIIVCDDGSRDDTAAVAAAFGSPVRLIQQSNQGAAAARNVGMYAARGRYIAFLDSDDIWFPWTLEHYRRAIVAGQPSMLVGANVVVDRWPASRPPEGSYSVATYATVNDFVARFRPICFYTGMLVIKAEVIRSLGGFDVARLNAEDIDLVLRMWSVGPVAHVASPPAYALRRGHRTISDSSSMSAGGVERLIRKERAAAYPGDANARWNRRALIAFMTRSITMQLASTGNLTSAARLYLLTFAWQMRLCRLMFLIGAPVISVATALKFWLLGKTRA